MHIDLSQYALSGKKALAAYSTAVELIDLMTKTKHAPSEVRLYPSDYKAIVNSIKRDFAKQDRANWRAENANRSKKDQVKWAEFSGKRVVDSISHGTTPLIRGANYSKPRKVEA